MKKIFAVLIMVTILASLVGCEMVETNTEQTSQTSQTSNTNVEIWTDEETGVQYIIYDRTVGYCGMGGITPRYNADGTLYTVGK